MISNKAPDANQIEITLFGPGFGEACVVHYGRGQWLIVDSCIDSRTQRVASLAYLEKIGVPFDAVKYVIATHWHADHVKGMTDTVKTCGSAIFCASAALQTREFISVLAAYAQTKGLIGGNGTEEYFETLDVLNERRIKVIINGGALNPSGLVGEAPIRFSDHV